MPLALASAAELDAVKKILQDPLTGRRVMIPFTSKAFFEGSLQPTIEVSSGKEQVMIKMTEEKSVEANRSDTLDLLEKRIQAVQETVRELTKKKANAAAASPKAPAVADDQPSGLPFFEIREEFDEHGKEISSEAINVAKELEFLQRSEEGKMDSAIRATPVKQPVVVEVEATATKPKVSDEEYNDIASRLEELSMLEEEAEAMKKLNQTSSKRLQGSGWAKGFLNKKKPAKKKPTKSAGKPKPLQAAAGESSMGRKVGFQEENNQIKEIPRVGERSLPSKAQSTQSTPTKPIENSVFNGVIQERPVASTVLERPTVTATGGVQERPAATAAAPKKKLSRFAQQRLEQQQQQQGTAPAKKMSKFAQDRQQIR